VNQTASEIETAFDTWFETNPKLPTAYSYSSEVNGWTGLVWYLEDECPKNEDDERWIHVPGIHASIALHETKGGEGEGDYAHAILKLSEYEQPTRFFMLDGYHRSHDGTYFDSGFHEVKPVQKLVDDWANV